MKNDGKIIDITVHLNKQRKAAILGSRICCPECDSHEYWKFYVKEHKDGTLHVTTIACTSDECDGNTILAIKDGIIL